MRRAILRSSWWPLSQRPSLRARSMTSSRAGIASMGEAGAQAPTGIGSVTSVRHGPPSRSRWPRSGRPRYMRGRRFPWQTTNNDPFRYELRYDPATDTAVGFKYGLEGRTCRVRLVPIH